MKKKALILGIILSTAAFGMDKGNFEKMDYHKKFKEVKEQRMDFFENLSEDQKNKIKELRLENIKKNSKLNLEADEKRIQIRKIMVEDKVAWDKVKKLTKEIGVLDGEINYNNLKNRYEIRKIAGFEEPMRPNNYKGMGEESRNMK